MRNPLMEIVGSAETILPSSDAKYSAKHDSLRKAYVPGMPLKTVITQVKENGREERTVLEVTRYGPARVNEADLKIPAGYTRKDNGLSGFKIKI
jgi:hypothetical protein